MPGMRNNTSRRTPTSELSSSLFSQARIWFLPVISIAIILPLHYLVRQLRVPLALDVDQFWPVSIAMPKYLVWQDAITLLAVALFWVIFIKLYTKASMTYLSVIAGLLIIATNLLNGYDAGLRYPIIGAGKHDSTYWQDSLNIQSASEYVSSFELIQPHMRVHSRTHPPGVLLFLYGLRQIFDNPIFVSLIILILSLPSAWFLYQIAKQSHSESIAKLVSCLFLLLPSIQIYFWSTIDALICCLFIGSYWAWQKRMSFPYFLVSLILVWMASFLTYGTVWLVCLLLFEEWRKNFKIKYTFGLIAALSVTYYLMFLASGFNYINSLLRAAELERSFGSVPGYSTGSFLFSRLENVLELLIFLGPYLGLLLYLSLKSLRKKFTLSQPATSPLVGIIGLIAMFCVGAYYTGETARAAMFIYPFLLLIIGNYLSQRKITSQDHFLLLSLVFGQSLLMQSFGWFAW